MIACQEKPPEGFLVIDLETTTSKDGNLRAIDGREPYLIGTSDEIYDYSASKQAVLVRPFKVLVGHNIKFDLEHIARSNCVKVDKDGTHLELMSYIRSNASVLDTQFITYLHSGHTVKFGSLEECCKYWGIEIKKTFDLGAELEKVDHDITKVPGILTYLSNDIDMTTLLINTILNDKWVRDNFLWILKMHDGLLGTFEIEYNGMHVDPSRLLTLTNLVIHELGKVTDDLNKMVGVPGWNPASNDDVAAYLFGGTFTIETRILNGVYATGKKAGQPRYKIDKTEYTFMGKHVAKPEWESIKTGKYQVNEDVLRTLNTEFTRTLLKYREYNKLLSTYLEGLKKHVRVSPEGEYYVYPQINLCLTATGRTSSSKPNMQNNPTHDSVGVASIYTSRFGKEGTLLEVDFKQIEVLALAILSQDHQLMNDILTGVDIHTATGIPVFGHMMTKEQRRVIKTINFGLIYGGSAATLATQAKVSERVAKSAIKSFYTRYPETEVYFEACKRSVQALLDCAGVSTGHYTSAGYMQKQAFWDSKTGRRYAFKDYYSAFSKRMEVSHTETRNYPIQGLATGDLMLAALGEVWRKVLTKYKNDVKLIGLVHDSLRFDIKLDKLDDIVADLKYTLENSGNVLNRACKKSVWTLPIKVTFSKGNDFFNMTEIE